MGVLGGGQFPPPLTTMITDSVLSHEEFILYKSHSLIKSQTGNEKPQKYAIMGIESLTSDVWNFLQSEIIWDSIKCVCTNLGALFSGGHYGSVGGGGTIPPTHGVGNFA